MRAYALPFPVALPLRMSMRRTSSARVHPQVGILSQGTRAVHRNVTSGVRRVARAGFVPAVSVGAAMRPNPAVERTPICVTSSALGGAGAAHLVRWGSWR